MSEHLTYLREVLEHDAIGFGEDFQFQDAVEHLEALEHASEQYRKVMTEQAKRIEQLEAALRPFAEIGEVLLPEDDKDDSIWVTCPDETPVNNLTNFGLNFGHFRAAARAALEGKDG